MYSYSKFVHQSDSLYPYVRPLSEEYRVFINGEEIPVYTCRISKYPFNAVWPGHQRQFDQTEEASFVNIVSDEEIRVEVLTKVDYKRVLIKPYSKKIEHTDEGEKISFTLKENGHFVLECDSYHHALYIFNSRPIAAPKREDVTYYFEPGIHFAGKISLKSNESVYIDKDALVYGCVHAEKAENLHVFGNGIFDDSQEERTGNYCYEDYVNGNMKFYECRNLKIEGVGMTNSAIWCLNIFACRDVVIDGIKIFGQWRYNTDGIDIVNSQDVYVKNSFVHSFDDTIVIKGIDRFYYIDNKNIHIENCVLWCDWGKCCELGVETTCREYDGISFINCDILRGGCAAMDIGNGECAEIHNVLFENIRVEYNSFDTVEVLQRSDEQTYEEKDSMATPFLILMFNRAWRTPETRKMWGLPPQTEQIDLTGVKSRTIHDVKVKDIYVYYDEGLPLQDGKPIVPIGLIEVDEVEKFYNIDISNVVANGIKIK